jgi:pimeloyl-ACP methyl ester carboxylesterase
MKVYKWPLLLLLLGVNQVIRTPFTLWNWSAQMKLRSSGFESVVYKTNSSRVEVFEKSLVAVGNDDSKEHSIKTNSGDTPVLVVLSDMKSSVGFWQPWLDELQFDGVVRFIEWYGHGESEWTDNAIVFSDLDSLLTMSLSDVEGEIFIVGQGIGAQLGIRYMQSHPELPIEMIAMHSAGFTTPALYPQTVPELKESVSQLVLNQWLPEFVYRDWLEWLDNPFSLAIEKETHLVPHFKLDELPAVTWVGFAPLDSGSVAEIQDCSGEVQWTCKDDFNNLVQKVVSNRQADSKDDVSSE